MDILKTSLPVIMVLLIVFSAPLFHTILAAGEGVGRFWGYVRSVGAAQASVSPAT
jgi:hypothetical protein